MSPTDRLRSAHADWKTASTDAMNALLLAAQPIIRATVRSILSRHSHLQDEAESRALETVWSRLGRCKGDIVPWVRRVARSRALDAIRHSARSKVDAVDDLESTTTVSTTANAHHGIGQIDLQALSPAQRAVCNLLMQGASQRQVQDELRMSYQQVVDTMGVIRQVANRQ